MHATGYLEARNRHPVALVAAITINLAAVGVMLAYNPEIVRELPGAIEFTQFAKPPKQKPIPIEPKAQQPKSTNPNPRPQPVPIDPIQRFDPIDTYQPTWPPMPPQPPMPTGDGPITKTDPIPVLIAASVDPRYAEALQPSYPANLERQEIEGKATVRVQIGTDGRVMAVELVQADDPGFFAATRDQALRRWRFRPATRDGQPIVSWVTKTVVFKVQRT